MKKSATFVLKTALLVLAQLSLVVYAIDDNQRDQQNLIVYGKGNARCEDDLPTLTVSTDNLVQTKEEWDDFVSKNDFFIVGAADSSCVKCCDSEPLLRDLVNYIKDKAVFSYP